MLELRRHPRRKRLATNNAALPRRPLKSSPAWIRTKTNRVRICCATVTLRDCEWPTMPEMAAPPGLEPGKTESKSVVLPLHQGAFCRRRADARPVVLVWQCGNWQGLRKPATCPRRGWLRRDVPTPPRPTAPGGRRQPAPGIRSDQNSIQRPSSAAPCKNDPQPQQRQAPRPASAAPDLAGRLQPRRAMLPDIPQPPRCLPPPRHRPASQTPPQVACPCRPATHPSPRR
jgi:hypothetical protein